MKERFNLEYLNTFVIAAETGKFNITAEHVYRSHSSVSTQIKKLEEQVGAPLFIRKQDSVILTKVGETLLDYATKILSLNDAAFNAVTHSSWEGTISFGIPTEYTNLFLSKVFPNITNKYPNFSFTTFCNRSREIRKQIEKGHLNIAIVAMESQYSGDIFLWEENLFWVASKEFTLQDYNPSLPIALFSDDCIINNYSLYCLKRANMDFKVVFKSTMLENILDCVKNGIAISLLPESLIDDTLQILPDNVIACPWNLNLGLIWHNTVNLDIIEEVSAIIKSSILPITS
ncbi:LysR family transcriptional regulator [Amphibacillus sp. Q70]|uniref:LysR family transcriptional regulator n=1 Tax=Amphibacillus sp. Q70 TaxID=3453416 RepID=UPI003F837552